MTDRTSVEDLIGTAEQQLWDIAADPDPDPYAALCAWPRLRAAAETYLVAAASPARYGQHPLSPPTQSPLRQPGRRPDAARSVENSWRGSSLADHLPDVRLLRVADLVGGAADIVSSHRATGDPATLVVSDPLAQETACNRAAELLLAGSQIIEAAYRRIPVGDRDAWRLVADPAARARRAAERILTDRGSRGPIDDLAVPGRPAEDPPGQFLAALRTWRAFALAVADGGTADADLIVHARAGELLMAVAARLDPVATNALAARDAWHTAAGAWSGRTTSQPGDPGARATLDELVDAARRLIATDPETSPRLHALVVETAATTTQVARAHGQLVDSLIGSGRVFAPARRLSIVEPVNPAWISVIAAPPSMTERLQARAAGRWIPITSNEGQPLLVAYQQTTATSRAVGVALNSPHPADPGTPPAAGGGAALAICELQRQHQAAKATLEAAANRADTAAYESAIAGHAYRDAAAVEAAVAAALNAARRGTPHIPAAGPAGDRLADATRRHQQSPPVPQPTRTAPRR